VDYLLLNGKKVCAIKIKKRSGRLRAGSDARAWFPKQVEFWCPARPVPDRCYYIKVRGAGVAVLDIKTVFGELAGGGYAVHAELALPE